jgi:hypothetical protein
LSGISAVGDGQAKRRHDKIARSKNSCRWSEVVMNLA